MRQDIEASVIGGLLTGGLTPAASEVLATLSPDAFSIQLYQKAFKVIQQQARRRNMIDMLMVAEECGEQHFADIIETARSCPSAANLKGYAGMVAENHNRHTVLSLLDELREPIAAGTLETSSRAMDELISRLSAVRKPKDLIRPVHIGELLEGYAEHLESRMRNGEESDTLKTGIEELDLITGGMNPEELVIVAARPGMGKTEFALTVAEGVANRVIPGTNQKRGVLIFSMEMSSLQIVERSVAGAGRLSVNKLRNPAKMDDEGWARVTDGIGRLTGIDIWVVDASKLSVEQIRSMANRHKEEHPSLSLILVDYLGLIEKPKAERNDLAIAHISSSLKGMAKDLRTTVMSLSQLSRDVENWSYTGKATFWKRLEGQNDYGDPLGFAAPVVIDCGYEGGLSKRLGDIGSERVIKNTFWTEFSDADNRHRRFRGCYRGNPTLRYPAIARADTKYGFTAAIPNIQLNIWNGDTVQLPSRYLIATVEELDSQLWKVSSIKPNTDNTVSLTVAEYSDAIYQ